MNLDKLFKPKSIAVIGASRDETAVGFGILKNLIKGTVFENDGATGFPGKVFPVNPKADTLLDQKCYSSVLDIPDPVDLAVIVLPAKIVPVIMKQCVNKQVGAAIIISAGFGESGAEGKKLQDEVVSIAQKGNIRIVGPNCLGVIRPHACMNASFAPTVPPKGDIAFISQSGALVDSVVDWAVERDYGFSTIVSYGNAADLALHDYLQWLADDEETKTIALYIEGIQDGKKFMEVAREVSKKKPIIALKGGKTNAGSQAISSHTGSLAGSYEAYKAAFHQSGVIIAEDLNELFSTAFTLANEPSSGKRMVIITNAGGPGVCTADYCADLGIELVEIKEETLAKLDASGVMHPAYSRRNPLDLVGDALPIRYQTALDILLGETYIDGAIVIQTLQTMTNPLQDAAVIIAAKKKNPPKLIIAVFMGGKYTKEAVHMLENNGVPTFNDPHDAAKALKKVIEYHSRKKT